MKLQPLYLDLLPAYVPLLVQCSAADGTKTDPTVDALTIYEEAGADGTFDSTQVAGSPFDPAQYNSKTGVWGVLVAKTVFTAGRFYVLVWELTVDGVTASHTEVLFACNAASFKATGFSTHSAADVKTAMEADGSKLDAVYDKLPTGTISDFDEAANNVTVAGFAANVGEALAALIELALVNETDATATLEAFSAHLASALESTDLSVLAIATAVQNAIEREAGMLAVAAADVVGLDGDPMRGTDGAELSGAAAAAVVGLSTFDPTTDEVTPTAESKTGYSGVATNMVAEPPSIADLPTNTEMPTLISDALTAYETAKASDVDVTVPTPTFSGTVAFEGTVEAPVVDMTPVEEAIAAIPAPVVNPTTLDPTERALIGAAANAAITTAHGSGQYDSNAEPTEGQVITPDTLDTSDEAIGPAMPYGTLRARVDAEDDPYEWSADADGDFSYTLPYGSVWQITAKRPGYPTSTMEVSTVIEVS